MTSGSRSRYSRTIFSISVFGRAALSAWDDDGTSSTLDSAIATTTHVLGITEPLRLVPLGGRPCTADPLLAPVTTASSPARWWFLDIGSSARQILQPDPVRVARRNALFGTVQVEFRVLAVAREHRLLGQGQRSGALVPQATLGDAEEPPRTTVPRLDPHHLAQQSRGFAQILVAAGLHQRPCEAVADEGRIRAVVQSIPIRLDGFLDPAVLEQDLALELVEVGVLRKVLDQAIHQTQSFGQVRDPVVGDRAR